MTQFTEGQTLSRWRLRMTMVSESSWTFLCFRVNLQPPTADITGIAAADLVHDFLSLFLTKEPPHLPVHQRRS